MTYSTHKAFAVWWVTLVHLVLWYVKDNNVGYYISWVIMLYAAKSGALFPDVDHHWEAVKEKTAINKVINSLIHMSGGKHRSWQTHSIDIVLIFSILAFFMPRSLVYFGVLSELNGEILRLLLLGFASGWFSHIIADMLTSAGVRLFCFRSDKIAFVPKQLLGLRFNTGNTWEKFVYSTTKKLNLILGILGLVVPIVIVKL